MTAAHPQAFSWNPARRSALGPSAALEELHKTVWAAVWSFPLTNSKPREESALPSEQFLIAHKLKQARKAGADW